ncbi:MAG: tyrosine-type recombinase/integrase [Terracidiphilus sp.]|jgi:integrase
MTNKNHIHRKPRAHSWTTLSNDQLSQILPLSAKDPLLHDVHDVVAIVTGTGIRTGELRDLRWIDVDLPKSKITIRNAKTSCVRTVPLGEDTLRVLEARRQRQPDSGCVLGPSARALLHRVSRKMATLSKCIGIGSISMQMLRRTFGVRLLNSGANIWSVMDMMGLSRPRSITH